MVGAKTNRSKHLDSGFSYKGYHDKLKKMTDDELRLEYYKAHYSKDGLSFRRMEILINFLKCNNKMDII